MKRRKGRQKDLELKRAQFVGTYRSVVFGGSKSSWIPQFGSKGVLHLWLEKSDFIIARMYLFILRSYQRVRCVLGAKV